MRCLRPQTGTKEDLVAVILEELRLGRGESPNVNVAT
jgi:hypothetical protein